MRPKFTASALCLILISLFIRNGIAFSSSIAMPSMTPTATAPVPPTFESGSLVTLPNYTAYIASEYEDGWTFVGETENLGVDTVHSLSITVDLYLAGSPMPSIQFQGHNLWYLQPNEKQCFNIGTFEGFPPFDNYEIHDPDHIAFDGETERLTISGFVGEVTATGNYSLTGYVQNNSPNGVTYILENATLYGAGGEVLDCAMYANTVLLSDLDAGETAPIGFLFRERDDYTGVVSFKVDAIGIPVNGTFTPTPTATPTLTPTPTYTPTPTATPSEWVRYLPVIQSE